MGKSTAGYILGLIGGIIGVIIGVVTLFVTIAAEGIVKKGFLVSPFGSLFTLTAKAMVVLGVWCIISAALVIWFSTWMKNPKKCRAGGIWTLVLSIIGAGGILGIIGGIFGIVQGGK